MLESDNALIVFVKWFHVSFIGPIYVQRKNGMWFHVPFVGLIYMQKKNGSHYVLNI